MDINEAVYKNDSQNNESELDNWTNDSTFEEEEVPSSYIGLIPILQGIICVVGLAGNALVIYAILRFSKTRTVTNLYIINLSIADTCLLLCVPFGIATFYAQYGSWLFGDFLCRTYLLVFHLSRISSALTVFVISADMYLVVCHPLNAPKWRTPLISKLVILSVWILSVLLITPVYMYGTKKDYGDMHHCEVFWPQSWTMTGYQIFHLYSFTASFAVPFIFICFFYVSTICRQRSMGPMPEVQSSEARQLEKSRRNSTVLVITIVTTFFLCWTPYWTIMIFWSFANMYYDHTETFMLIHALSICLWYSHSAINPILYTVVSEDFRKSFKEAFTFGIKNETEEGSSSMEEGVALYTYSRCERDTIL